MLKPDSDQEKMCQYIWDQFHVVVSASWVSRHLALAQWSRHTLKLVAKEREQVIRNKYISAIGEYQYWQFVFIDESRCNHKMSSWKHAWWPVGSGTPSVEQSFHYNKCDNFLPAVNCDGVLDYEVYKGYTYTEGFA